MRQAATAFTNHFSFEFRTGIRDKNSLLLNYLFPVGLYVLLGLFMSELNPEFTETMIPAMIIVGILSGTVLGLPNPLVAARESGIFRSYKINGVPASSILAIPALTTIAHVVVVAVIITVTAPQFFDAPTPVNWGGLVLVVVLTAFASAGLGVLIGVVSANSQVTVLWSQLIFLPSMLIGGLMVPLSDLPDSFSKIGLLLPANHAMNAYQRLAQDQSTSIEPLWSVLVLVTGAVSSFGLAVYLFNWDNRNPGYRKHPALALLAMVPYAIGAALLA